MTENEVRSLRAALEQLRDEVTTIKDNFASFKKQRLERDSAIDERRWSNIKWAAGLVAVIGLSVATGVLYNERRASRVETAIENLSEAAREIKVDMRDIRNGQRSQISTRSLRKEARAD